MEQKTLICPSCASNWVEIWGIATGIYKSEIECNECGYSVIIE
jgi:hypothetical protein